MLGSGLALAGDLGLRQGLHGDIVGQAAKLQAQDRLGIHQHGGGAHFRRLAGGKAAESCAGT